MDNDIIIKKILSNILHETTSNNLQNVNLDNIKMWFIPQKTENDESYEINKGYYELLVKNCLEDLTNKGLLEMHVNDNIEDHIEYCYIITEKGFNYINTLRENFGLNS